MECMLQKALDAMIYATEYSVKRAIREFCLELGIDMKSFSDSVIDVCNIHRMPAKNNHVECGHHKISVVYQDTIPNIDWIKGDDYEKLRECLAYLLYMVKEFFTHILRQYPEMKMNIVLDPNTTSYKLEKDSKMSTSSLVFKIE